MKWFEKIKNIGPIKEKASTNITYNYLGSESIKEIKPSCGSCTKVVSFKDNILTIKFTAGEIPKYLGNSVEEGLPLNKKVLVTYENGQTDVLQFVGYIKGKNNVR